jgi:ABC-type lipopolysaccharide export system ATPase subunit
MLAISHLSKTYPDGVKALNDVSLNIDRGLLGLLGPNGALHPSCSFSISHTAAAKSGAHCNSSLIATSPAVPRTKMPRFR